MSPTTVARRAKAGRFNTVESDRFVAWVAVSENTLYLVENDVAAAARWMNSSRGLGWNRPLDMIRTRVETKAVFDLIGRLDKGVLVRDSIDDLLGCGAKASLLLRASVRLNAKSSHIDIMTFEIS